MSDAPPVATDVAARERAKWDDYYAALGEVEETPPIRAFGAEFVDVLNELLPAGGAVLEAGSGAGFQSLALAREGQQSGDLAGARGRDGAPLPQLAAVAQQAGRHAAAEIERSLRGADPQAFRYQDKGTLAIIADRAAVADLPFGVTVHGLPAWVLWLGVHVVLLPDPVARLGVVTSWVTRSVRALPGPLRPLLAGSFDAAPSAPSGGTHDR